jgi:probable DNA metabolism protein
LRFKELENELLYSEISPDNNIITILAKHFKIRLPCYKWIIHDKKRNLAILYNKSKFIIVNFDLRLLEKLPNKELYYQNLWKNYFNNISIKNRENKKLQKQHIPTRYWKYLVEELS